MAPYIGAKKSKKRKEEQKLIDSHRRSLHDFLKSNMSTLRNPVELTLVVLAEKHSNIDLEDEIGTEENNDINAGNNNKLLDEIDIDFIITDFASRNTQRNFEGEMQGQEDLQIGRRQGGRHRPRRDEVEPHRPCAQQPDVCDHGMAARLAKLRAIDVEYKRIVGVVRVQGPVRCGWSTEAARLASCSSLSLPWQPNRHHRPRVAQVRSSSWKFMTWSMSLAPQGPLHFRVVVTGGYKGKWVWADREVYDTGVKITRLCFPCDMHESR